MPARISIQAISAEARLERDKARSRAERRAQIPGRKRRYRQCRYLQAQEKLVDIINRCEIETPETLIKQRFSDALVYISDTEFIDVIVNASSLSSQQVAVWRYCGSACRCPWKHHH